MRFILIYLLPSPPWTNPIDRSVQRFSRDLYVLDREVPDSLAFFLFTSLSLLTTLITITAVTPIFLAFLVPLAVVYFFFLHVYRPVMRDAKRLSSIATSPVFALFSETLVGCLRFYVPSRKRKLTTTTTTTWTVGGGAKCRPVSRPSARTTPRGGSPIGSQPRWIAPREWRLP